MKSALDFSSRPLIGCLRIAEESSPRYHFKVSRPNDILRGAHLRKKCIRSGADTSDILCELSCLQHISFDRLAHASSALVTHGAEVLLQISGAGGCHESYCFATVY